MWDLIVSVPDHWLFFYITVSTQGGGYVTVRECFGDLCKSATSSIMYVSVLLSLVAASFTYKEFM